MAENDTHGEAELVAEALAGDHAAWALLCRRHAPRLAAYLGARLRRPDVVDQLVGDTVVSAWAQLPGLENPGDFAAWFRRTGAGIALRWAREHPDEMLTAVWSTTRHGGGDQVELARLDHLIGELEEAERMALELRWRGGLMGADLAAALRCTPEEAERLANVAESEIRQRWDSP